MPAGVSILLEDEHHTEGSGRMAEVVAAVGGITACALAGATISAAQADDAIAMMGNAGLFNHDVLFTDLVMQGVDVANTYTYGGWAVLSVALIMYLQAQGTLPAVDEPLEDLACLVEEHICGPASFDSGSDMVCIEDYSSGKLRWVCA